MVLFNLLLTITMTQAFYQMPAQDPYKWISSIDNVVVPTTNDELKTALCSKIDHQGTCIDNDLKLILITKIFDFTDSEGTLTEEGCYHLSTPKCLEFGQKKLNVNNQCDGLTKVMITYNKAGTKPLKVGSNKYIVSTGAGGLKGKGLKVCDNNNILIYGLNITDINAELIWGGDAIQMDNASNIWIHGNYFSRIGRQMIVTGLRACQNITISDNEFDGRTPNSAYCDGSHYWLWLFVGSDDTITLYKNYVHHTSGRGGHITGLNNNKALIHMIKNKFANVSHSGLVEAYDPTARILIEGNSFNNVSAIVSKNGGRIFYPFTADSAASCKQYINRECYMNSVSNSGGLNFKSDDTVLKELSKCQLVNTDQIDKFDSLANQFGSLDILKNRVSQNSQISKTSLINQITEDSHFGKTNRISHNNQKNQNSRSTKDSIPHSLNKIYRKLN